MATATTSKKKVILYYSKGSYSFDKINLNADPEKIHRLALALNAFQSQKPPTKIVQVVTTEIM